MQKQFLNWHEISATNLQYCRKTSLEIRSRLTIEFFLEFSAELHSKQYAETCVKRMKGHKLQSPKVALSRSRRSRCWNHYRYSQLNISLTQSEKV